MQNFNRATRYLEKSNPEKAIQFFRRQLREHEFKECWLNMGNAYKLVGNDQQALACFIKANAPETPFLNGGFGSYDYALGNIGLMHYIHGDDDGAIAYYTAALEKNPLHFDSIWNYSTALLRKHCSLETVDVTSAWQMYEYRFRRTTATPVDCTIPRWNGVTPGRSIVVLAEQGLGDKLMWGRYVQCLQAYFQEVWVQCPATLHEVFAEFKTCENVLESTAETSIPICSLASVFPPQPANWLQHRYGVREFAGTKLKIGIEWAGSTTHSNDKYRSTLPAYFLPLLKYADLYSLRPDAAQVRGVVALNCDSWKTTAEAINGLDLVISVDTSVVHMCGSIGKPCWLLQPIKETDFRWGNNAMNENNIWYPTVKVIRNPGNWDAVFKTVLEKIQTLELQNWKNTMQALTGSLHAHSIKT